VTIAMQPIYTQTVGTNAPVTITFNNIPQTFTDLQIVVSARATNSAIYYAPFFLSMNGLSSIYSDTILFAQGSSVTSVRNSYGPPAGAVMLGYAVGNTAIANTFSSLSAYIPNYTASNFKQIISDNVGENNSAADNLINLSSCLLRSTAAITSLTFNANGAAFAQYTTFTLYGITKG